MGYSVCIVGGYTMDLYCKNAEGACDVAGKDGVGHGYNEFPHQFTGQNYSECVKEAKRRGWKIRPLSDQAVCPHCTNKNRRIKKA